MRRLGNKNTGAAGNNSGRDCGTAKAGGVVTDIRFFEVGRVVVVGWVLNEALEIFVFRRVPGNFWQQFFEGVIDLRVARPPRNV
jgi:hypothetical protein